MSLGNKIILLGLFVILVPLCIIGVFFDLGQQRRVTERTFYTLEEAARQQKTHLDKNGMMSMATQSAVFNFYFLGNTGETMILVQETNGGFSLAYQPRFFKDVHSEFLTEMLARIEQSYISKVRRLRFEDYRGNDVFAVIAPSSNPKILIVSKIDASEALKPLDNGRDILLLSSFVAIIFIIFSGLIIAKSFTDPLQSLSLVISDFANNPTAGFRSTIQTGDEIGTLSDSFNMMAEKLENELRERIKFKLAVDNSAEQIVITDTEGIVLYANKAMETITGYTQKEAVGKKSGTLWSSPMPKEYYQHMWRVIKTDKRIFHSQIKNRRKNGTLYDADISISPVIDPQTKNLLFFVGMERDITKEKEIDRAKSEFVSLVSHQLRTPATNINWFLGMLLSGEVGALNKKQKEYFDEVYQNNQRMIVMINTFLNISRIRLGTFLIRTQPADISLLIKNALEENKINIQQKRLNITEKYPQVPIVASIDKKLFDIVFQNIISNAIKYTQFNGTLLTELLIKRKGEKIAGQEITEDSFVIAVSDNGYGIPENQYDKIFTRFFRADNVKITDTDGSGLGLYFAKLIMDQINGHIWFTSVINKGTVFYVAFPLSGMKNREGEKESPVGSLGGRF